MLSEKVDLIKLSLANPKVGSRKLAEKYEIGKTQVNSILSKKNEYLQEWASNVNPKDKKRGRPSEFGEINKIVFKWFCMVRESNVTVSGTMIQEEATEIAKSLNITNFKASNGWLEKWKIRYNIGELAVSGEDGDVDEGVIGSWSERLQDVVEGYELKDIFNCDETAFILEITPDKTLAQKKKKCKGGKKSKQRLTALFFVSALGDKLESIINGKSAKPRCFRNLKQKSRPH